MKNQENDKRTSGNADKAGSKSSGNFKNDPGRASEAGRKGGESRTDKR